MNGGVNCHIFIKEEHFINFHRKVIPCSIVNGDKSKFQGVGIGVAETDDENFVLLAPAYISTQDGVNTISPGALTCYSNCTQSTHVALKSLIITTKHDTYTLPTNTAGGLEYILSSNDITSSVL